MPGAGPRAPGRRGCDPVRPDSESGLLWILMMPGTKTRNLNPGGGPHVPVRVRARAPLRRRKYQWTTECPASDASARLRLGPGGASGCHTAGHRKATRAKGGPGGAVDGATGGSPADRPTRRHGPGASELPAGAANAGIGWDLRGRGGRLAAKRRY